MLTHVEPFVATEHPPPVFSPYLMSMMFTPVRGRFRLDGKKVLDYAVPRCTLTLVAERAVEHLASHEGGRGVMLSVNSDEYTSSVNRLVQNSCFEDGVIHRTGDAVAWAIMVQLRSLLRDDPDPSFLALDTLSVTLQRQVVAIVGGGDKRSGRNGDLSQIRLRKVTNYVDEHLDENISLTALSQVAALSPFHFLRSFKRTTGMNPHQFVINRKLEAARIAIEYGIPPWEAAESLGFRHPRHFAVIYRRHHGFWPADTSLLEPRSWLHSAGSLMSPAALTHVFRNGAGSMGRINNGSASRMNR